MAAFAFLVLSLSLSSLSLSGASDPVSADRVSLLGFKLLVTDDPSDLLSGWNPPTRSHCEWYGVTCNKFSGRVTALNLTGAGPHAELVGTLADSVGNLTELRVLSLPYNAFSGDIPAEALGRLRHMEVLQLQGNNFSGSIPDQICTLPSLGILNLSYNSLSGPIPDNLIGFSVLEVVDLSHNHLSGKIRVSPFVSCQYLTCLKLSGNFLVDRIPPEIGKCYNLRSVLLDGNILEGRIPAQIGKLSELRILDVSRNSLTDRIPRELGNCRKLSLLILTDLVDNSASSSEFNAFVGSIPSEILLLPSLEILWAPRANLGGRLPSSWNGLCRLQVLNLGQNYLTGPLPEELGMCRNLSFLDLSSNKLQGPFPSQLLVGCMTYLNVSHNSLSGSLPGFAGTSCLKDEIFDEQDNNLSVEELLENAYSETLLRRPLMSNPFGLFSDEDLVVLHDFSWNGFAGPLPSFSLPGDRKISYGLFLNNNGFNGSFPGVFFTAACKYLEIFEVNLSFNHISGEISPSTLSNCLQLKRLDAAYNRLRGSIPTGVGDLVLLSHLDLRGNRLNGTIPEQLGKLKNMERILLGGNGLTGEIPPQLGEMVSLTVLDLSRNALTGNIPPTLASASNLQVLLLDHNRLLGEIPPSFSMLTRLNTLDVSFNNLSGYIPNLPRSSNCDSFKDNSFVQPCPDPYPASPAGLPHQLQVQKWGGQHSKLESYVIATVASAAVIVCVLIVLVLFLAFGRRKIARLASLRKVVMTFTASPTELNYDNVVKATGNFSIQNLIGMGGFGSTYKAELVPGFLVAVKRLSIGRFQGLQQFDAEIRTLGRIQHKNLVTLIGYHMGEVDTFLIYNYLSGGNLEAFIHDRSGKNAHWPVIHKIALDVAQALAYLHYSCVPRIVHRDIKPSNILLDEKLNAYLSDFGLARLLEVSETHATTDVAGTFGYVAPEYATTCRVSDKADVYSFGVVLLELMSGKRSLDPSFSEYGNGFNIVAWGKMLIKEGHVSELFSPALWEAGPKDNLVGMLRLASACTVESLSVRPSMKQVVDKLKNLKNY